MQKIPYSFLINFHHCFHAFEVQKWNREREHEAQDVEAFNEPTKLQALRNCGMLKYFMISGMKAQVDLLTWLVRA